MEKTLINLGETVYRDKSWIKIAREKIAPLSGRQLDVDVYVYTEFNGDGCPDLVCVTAQYKDYCAEICVPKHKNIKTVDPTVKELDLNHKLKNLISRSVNKLRDDLNKILRDLT